MACLFKTAGHVCQLKSDCSGDSSRDILSTGHSLFFAQNLPYRLGQLSHFEWLLNKTVTASFQYLGSLQHIERLPQLFEKFPSPT
jgi:hypothetical protein